jgi:VIT1/CCC1 family predicted Fe2+/Mn2+ transporter
LQARSLAIGDYISSKSEVEYFEAEINRESLEIQDNSPVEREEVRQIYVQKAPFMENERACDSSSRLSISGT